MKCWSRCTQYGITWKMVCLLDVYIAKNIRTKTLYNSLEIFTKRTSILNQYELANDISLSDCS